MAYRYGNRSERMLLPESIEEYVSTEDPVRAYDAFVESLDIRELGIEVEENQVGPPEYDPVSMLKLLVYGYSYGIRSSRKLERAVHHNLSFIWLVGGIRPDHKTISLFRQKHREGLGKVLRLCARMCVRLGLVEGNVLFVDGTKIQANASMDRNWDTKRCEQTLAGIDRRVECLLQEIETMDQQEQEQGSMVRMEASLADQDVLRARVKEMAHILQGRKNPRKGTAPWNETDPESRLMRSSRGATVQGYNGQIVCDAKHGLIVGAEVVNQTNDQHQLSPQIQQAQENLGKKCEKAVADAGYYSMKALAPLVAQGTQVILPTPKSTNRWEIPDSFGKSAFRYDKSKNCYWCPQGHALQWVKPDSRIPGHVYTIEKAKTCRACIHWGVCTKSKIGRTIIRLEQEELREEIRNQFETPEVKKIFARRKAIVEHPFGHLKRNLGMRTFLLRGVKAEFSLATTAFNLTRLLHHFGGTKAFIQALGRG